MILVESRGRVLLGGVGSLIEEERELAWAEKFVVPQNRGLAWVLGNFVEADNANTNGHIFDLEDLQTAQQTIRHTPINMLHRPHYIVGNFVASELMYPKAAGEAAAQQHPIVEALGAFYRYYYPDEYRTLQAAHADGQLFFCVDEETELLSASGWKGYSELAVGDVILTLNRETGLSEWTELDRLHVFPHSGEVVRMEGQMHSSVTTPDHRWWVERRPHCDRGNPVWEWRTTTGLTQETSIPRAVPHAAFPDLPKYEDALVELEAWFWTEGTDPGSGAVIYQSEAVNPTNCDRIAACLTRLFGPPARVRDGGLWYRTTHGRMSHFHLCKEAADRLRDVGGKVPSAAFICSLTESQLRLFIEVSLLGDGNVHKGHGQVTIDQTDPRGLRSFEMACALAGIPTNTTRQADGQWHCCLVRRSNRITPVANAQRGQGFVIEREHHEGIVWCPQTENQTFLARRKGTVWWTGNSMECVPEKVKCSVGAGGCGQEFAYAGRVSDTYCAHINRTGSHKLLMAPTFTGGALIVPPVRPGWKRADITELSALLEDRSMEMEVATAYDQISREFPHLDGPKWESMMAALLRNGYGSMEGEWARDFSMAQRKQLATEGKAMGDGSYPIVTPEDLGNAISDVNRTKAGPDVKAHIRKRAKALGKTNLIPSAWSS